MGKDCISKLYIGNLSPETTEESLRSFLDAGGITLRNIFCLTVKKGYAFMQCGDQATADLIIDKFHGSTFKGNLLCIEPAVSTLAGANKKHGRCLITTTTAPGENMTNLTVEHIDFVLGQWSGSVLSYEKQNKNAFIATITDTKLIHDLVASCTGREVNGCKIKVEIIATDAVDAEGSANSGDQDKNVTTTVVEGEVGEGERGRSRFIRNRSFDIQGRNLGNVSGTQTWTYESPQFPWRMLIPSNQVGALIGRCGSTIKGISQETGARVNIHTGRPSRNNVDIEKIVSVNGSPESISAACKRILEVLVEDNARNYGADVILRLLAYNSLIGRLIGKGGSNITQIMQESQTKIHISNIDELPRSFLKHEDSDRIISIRGSIKGMCLAEDLVSAKLRISYGNDVESFQSTSTAQEGYKVRYYQYY